MRRAFSLVELIVVMVILGMLAGLVAVQTRGYLINAKKNAAKAQVSSFVDAIEYFYTIESRYPTTEEGLDILTEISQSSGDSYLKTIPKDPWKNPYEYVSPGSNGPYEVVCLGADGREGGEGENQDITSDTIQGENA